MFKKTFYKSAKINSETPSYLYYYILENEISYDGFSSKSYGVEVVKIKYTSSDDILRSSMQNIYPRFSQIVNLIDALAQKCVTPANLRDTVCSILSAEVAQNQKLYGA